MSLGITAMTALVLIVPCVIAPLAVLAYLFIKERRK
jgi:hypothetical protein